MEPLTPEEEAVLASLLKRLTWPMAEPVFRALLHYAVNSVAVDLLVFDKKGRVLLTYRKDDEYVGHHIPGTVIRFNESVDTALSRLIKTEMPGLSCTDPISLGWHQILKGTDPFLDRNRSSIALVHACDVVEHYTPEDGDFFDLDNLPLTLLPYQRVEIEVIRDQLNR